MRAFEKITLLLFCVSILTGCSKVDTSVLAESEQHNIVTGTTEPQELTISFQNYDFSDVTKIVFYYYLYPEDATVVTDTEEVEEICEFLGSIVGVNGTSNKGYSGGTYRVELYSGEMLKDFFFFEGTGGNIVQYGYYDDQYWVRYEMVGMTGEDVDLFFDQHKSE